MEKTIEENSPRAGIQLYTQLHESLERANKNSDAVARSFMERNIRLAVKIAGEMDFLPAPFESRISSALEGLREATLRFDADKRGKYKLELAITSARFVFGESGEVSDWTTLKCAPRGASAAQLEAIELTMLRTSFEEMSTPKLVLKVILESVAHSQ